MTVLAITAPPAETFARQGYAVVRDLVPRARVAMVRDHLARRAADGSMRMTGDSQVPGTPCTHGDSLLDWLMNCLRPEIEVHTGMRLVPTYSYARIYKRGDALAPHRDRESCEISVSINLDLVPVASPWALNIGNGADVFAALLLPGDALIYRGIDYLHWRDPFVGDSATQVFFHYVDRGGPYADLKFDGRSAYAVPKPTQSA